ncbi:MAG TPA: ABC transporter substrate-binding protein, partial [Candidatus Limnocylindrales bacterium]|nr:ABC transporter substrate-binding protein [Candidatus Limnocylindrales bacterium]
MSDPTPGAGLAGAEGGPTTSLTRGFLFADLRGYTQFVESHGAARASDLLDRYRTLVRAAVTRFRGAEIKTEGDSFYVVFDAVSAAIGCGLAIVEGAAAASAEHPDEPIQVGIGIHAGETVATTDGYVGSAVNVAARICTLANPGEVLVSDTVRTLTQAVLPVMFDPRGRRQLKGVSEPVAVFAVISLEEGADAWQTGVRQARARRMRRRRAGLAIVGVVAGGLVLAVGWLALRPPPSLPPGPWTIGLDMPLTGDAASRGIPVQNAVKLAIDEANAKAGIGGAQLVLDSRDDAGDVPGGQDPARGAANVSALVADPRTIAMVGPWRSGVAWEQIPITNAAGLLQCSPANSDPALTKPRDGALDLRSAAKDRINYVRTAPADDIQGPALASFIFHDLGQRSLLVIDDGDFGREIADRVAEGFRQLGGTVTRLALNPGADPTAVITPLSTATGAPGAVFFGGFADTGAPQVRQAMVNAGFGSIPFVSWDGIGGSGAEDGSFIQQAGTAAVGSYQSHASIAPAKAGFAERYRAAFAADPDEYAAAAYACAEVIFAALGDVAAQGVGAEELREAVRASAVDPSHRYDTILGSLGFDANGDSSQQFVTFYRV